MALLTELFKGGLLILLFRTVHLHAATLIMAYFQVPLINYICFDKALYQSFKVGRNSGSLNPSIKH